MSGPAHDLYNMTLKSPKAMGKFISLCLFVVLTYSQAVPITGKPLR